MPLRILTDEHIGVDVSLQLAALGYDVVSVRDRGLLRWKDWDLMAWCIREGRAICTKNGADFEREHRRCQARAQDHHGVIVVGDWTPRDIYESLRRYLAADPDRSLQNQVVHLPKPG